MGRERTRFQTVIPGGPKRATNSKWSERTLASEQAEGLLALRQRGNRNILAVWRMPVEGHNLDASPRPGTAHLRLEGAMQGAPLPEGAAQTDADAAER